jgi:hypothetical protein
LRRLTGPEKATLDERERTSHTRLRDHGEEHRCFG